MNDTPRLALVADVIGSRKIPDQEWLFRSLSQALERVDRAVPSEQPLSLTIGDELQGVFVDLPLVLAASLRLQLELIGTCCVRLGLGRGTITAFQPERHPAGQSGTAWWAARQAMDEVKANENRKRWPRSSRSHFIDAVSRGNHEGDLQAATVNALLLIRDHLVGQMDENDGQIALALFDGRSQGQVAEKLGLAQSTISWRQMHGGANTLYQAQMALLALAANQKTESEKER